MHNSKILILKHIYQYSPEYDVFTDNPSGVVNVKCGLKGAVTIVHPSCELTYGQIHQIVSVIAIHLNGDLISLYKQGGSYWVANITHKLTLLRRVRNNLLDFTSALGKFTRRVKEVYHEGFNESQQSH